MINSVTLIGRLTKEPELRYTPSGIAVCRFTLAINRMTKNEAQQQADFINIVTWRKQAENVANYLHKGSLAGVVGRIQTGSYDGQDGKKVYTTEVIAEQVQFLDSKSEHGNSNGTPAAAPQQQPQYQAPPQQQQGPAQSQYQAPQQQQNHYDARQHTPQNYNGPTSVPRNEPNYTISDDDLPF